MNKLFHASWSVFKVRVKLFNSIEGFPFGKIHTNFNCDSKM